MSVGRISGPLLKSNLLRDGVDLAFENDLIYLKVSDPNPANHKVGIKTTSPTHDLTVSGTTRTTYLEVTNQLQVSPYITISGNTIESSDATLYLNPAGDGVVYQNKLTVNDIDITSNVISANSTNTDIEIHTSGTGSLKVYANTLIEGNVHATGNISADGDIIIGDQNTDNITFNADVSSNIIPNITDFYDLGSSSKRWNNVWTQSFYATEVVAGNIEVDGINLTLPQGNIIYVAVNGNDANSGTHQNDPFLTIKHALSQATFGETVYVYPGVYEEICPLTIPVGVTLKGASLRDVIVTPTVATRDKDVILLNGETTVEDLTVSGHFYNSLNNTGHAFRFANNFSVSTRSPYVRNVTVISSGTPTVLSVNAYQTQNNNSILRIKDIIDEIVTNAAITKSAGNLSNPITDLINPSDGATGLILQALIDDVIYVINNGANTSSLPSITPNGTLTVDTNRLNAAALISSNITFLKDEMVAWINVNYPGFWGTYDQNKAKRDLGYILEALIYDIRHGGNEKSIATGIGYWQYSSTDPRGYDQHDAGRGAYIDGAVANISTKEASMLFHSVTFLCPGIDTITMTNGVRVEWLNCFTYWANRGLYAIAGNSGIASNGRTMIKVSGVTGSYTVGQTVSLYAADHTTVLASGTISEIDGSKIYMNTKRLGFVQYSNRVGKTVTVNGDAKISTAQSQFGGSSLVLDGTGDYLDLTNDIDFGFATGDFTIEFWVRRNSNAISEVFVDFRTQATQAAPVIYATNTNLYYYVSGANVITATGAVPSTGVWYHIAVSRVSGSTKMYVNGTQKGSTWTDSTNYVNSPVRIGANYAAASFVNGYIDELRISKGIARYNGAFIVPVNPFGGDSYTSLLLHFTGTNGSTTITDDSTIVQDIRFSGGATATFIDFVDYTDFGAEVRSIGSAAVYGDYGIYGDGQGVLMYLIGQNLAYIGLGKSSDNDPTAVIQTHEVVKLNGAKVYFSSVDHKGDFRVGDLFYVNQETGSVQFTDSVINVVGPTGITFTSGPDVTIIAPDKVQTGNLKISGNTIESLVNEVNITAANDIINLENNVFVTGDLDVTGNVTIGGNITIGDQTTDSVTFVAGIDSDLIPRVGAKYNIGSSSLQWKDLWIRQAHISDIEINTNYIRTTVSNANLELRANGTGSIQLEQTYVNENLIYTVGGTNLKIEPATTLDITASTTNVNGMLHVTGDVSFDSNITLGDNATDNVVYNARVNSDIVPAITSAYNLGSPSKNWAVAYLSDLWVDDIHIDTNVIQTTVSNSNLELRANGTGSIQIEQTYVNQNLIYTVNSTNLKIEPATTLDITASTTNINGDLHTTGSVVIDGSTTLGNSTSDNVFYNARVNSDIIPTLPGVYNLGSNSLPWNTVYLSGLYVDDISIDTNIIRTIASNANLELRANGTGSIQVEQTYINENLIYTVGGTNLKIEPATTLDITASTTNVNGMFHVTGDVSFDSNITLGTDPTDTVFYNARVDSNIVPTISGIYDLGSSTNTWAIAHLSQAYIDDILVDTNIIQTTVSNSNLELRAHGTGSIQLEQTYVNENLIYTVGGTNLRIEPSTTLDITASTTHVNGMLHVTGDVSFDSNITLGDTSADAVTFNSRVDSNIVPTITGIYDLGSPTNTWQTAWLSNANIDDININTNVIQSTVSNENLELRASGTGAVQLEQTYVNENVISTIGTNLEIRPATTLDITASVTNINGDLHVTGNITYDSNIVYGDSPSDNVTFVARVNSDIVPATTSLYTLGSPSKTWATAYLSDLWVDDIHIDTNIIQTTASNSNLELRANGTGSVQLEQTYVNENLIYTVNSTNLRIEPATTLDITASTTHVNGMLHVTGDVSFDSNITLGTDATDNVVYNARVNSDIVPAVTSAYNLGSPTKTWATAYLSQAYIDDILIDTNIIQTTSSNENLELRANGTGSVQLEQTYVNENLIYTVGATNLKIEPATTLDITASTTNVNGMFHVTGDVSFDSNITLGTDSTDNVVYNARVNSDIVPSISGIYNLGSPTKTWNISHLSNIFVDDINIDTNIIQTTNSNSNLELRANGTGSVQLEQTYVNENLIYTVGTNLKIEPATTLDITASTTNINGQLHVTGNTSFDSNITLGTDPTDNVYYNARVNSDIIPAVTSVWTLGSPTKTWATAHLSQAYIDDILIDTNIIQTINSNSNLELRANGTGSVQLEQTYVNENLIYTVGTNLKIEPATTLDITASTTNVNGMLHVTGDVSFDSNITLGTDATDNVVYNARVNSDIVPSLSGIYNLGSPTKTWNIAHLSNLYVDDINIDTNIIQTTVSNSNLELRANGTGSVQLEQTYVNENLIYTVGTTNLIIDPAGTLEIISDTNITGDLYVTGNVTIGGNITVGNQNTDNIVFEADVNSDLIPNLPVTYNLGSAAKRWQTLYSANAQISDIEISTNYIRTTVSNADLELRANGTGGILLEQVKVNENVISVPTNTNLIVQPSGTGIVDINSNQALRLPRGLTSERPGTPLAGMIRYNTTNSNFEGYDGTYWRVLNGLYDVSQNTRITAELTPGANDSTFRFYANNVQIADLTATRLNAIRVDVDDVVIDNNNVYTINNKNLNLTAQGTGVVKIENFEFKNNYITNSVPNSVTRIVQTGTGYFKIDGTTGFVIPVGKGNERPLVPETGFLRFNTDDRRMEIYDGTSWTSAAGNASGITVYEAEQTSILYALMLG